jgi:AcrR family transcriptional regulator
MQEAVEAYSRNHLIEGSMGLVQLLIDNGQITDPDSSRGRLLECAANLFSEKGYERTTVRDIADAVGIKSGSIFYHFASKQEMLRSLMTESVLCFTEKLRAAVDEASTPEEKVLACIQSELQFTVGDDSVAAMSVLVSEWRSLDEDGQKKLLAVREAYEEIWMNALSAAKAEGFVEGNVFILRRLLAGAINWSPNWFRVDGLLSLDDLASEVFRVVCAGRSDK